VRATFRELYPLAQKHDLEKHALDARGCPRHDALDTIARHAIARRRCAILQKELHRGISADEKCIHELMERLRILVTVLAPKIGYDNAAKVAKSAHMRGTALKEETLQLGFVSAEAFDCLIQPATSSSLVNADCIDLRTPEYYG
jgi:aspartate ammonia-lyase